MSFTSEERWDQGRMFELTFSFIESGKREFPSVQTSTGDAVAAACTTADYAATTDFVATTASALKTGAAAVSQAVSTAAAWGRKAQALANDATNLYHMVGTLTGGYGRYFGGRAGGGIVGAVVGAAAATAGGANTVSGLIALGSAARAKVAAAAGALSSTAAGLGS